MSVYDDITTTTPRDTLEGFWSGTIAKGAANEDDTVDVLIASFDNKHRFGPCKWVPNGTNLPERGNYCLTVFNEAQVPHVIAWWPFDPTFPPVPPPEVEVPIGGIVPYSGSSDPSGGKWLIADGRALDRVGTYAALFAITGILYGAGNGTTTFNIPNLKGKVPVGLDSGQTEFDTRGESGGAKTHTLSTAEMPSHGHTWNENGFGLTHSDEPLGGGSVGHYVRGIVGSGHEPVTSTGGGGAHNNLQPYVVTNYIIRVL